MVIWIFRQVPHKWVRFKGRVQHQLLGLRVSELCKAFFLWMIQGIKFNRHWASSR